MNVRFDFEDLLVYQKAIEFADVVYKATRRMPEEERHGLASQFQQAGTGIALNLSEGSGGTKTEFKRFIRMAGRSVRECVAITEIASRADYFDRNQRDFLRERLAELSKMLSGLSKSLSIARPKERP